MVKIKAQNLSSYKVRKSGNSDVTTIPSEVKKVLGIQTGDSISFTITDSGSVEIKKVEPQVDIDVLIEESMDQYHRLLSKLVDV